MNSRESATFAIRQLELAGVAISKSGLFPPEEVDVVRAVYRRARARAQSIHPGLVEELDASRRRSAEWWRQLPRKGR